MRHMPDITETLYVTTAEEWREWLVQNHDKKQEIWLILPKKATGKPHISYNDSVEQALCFGWIDSIQKTLDETSTVQRFSPRKIKGNFSQPNIERLRLLAEQGQLMPFVLEMAKPELDMKFVFAEDIMEAIEKNPTAHKNFQTFSLAYQRIRVAYIEGARSRPEEFAKRLQNFTRSCEANKLIGIDGMEKYY